MVVSPSLADAIRVVAAVPDPEIPVVTLEDLGILRNVCLEGNRIVVTLTPTYSGCPATEAIKSDVKTTLLAHGFENAQVRITLTPAWTTDWITDVGKQKLREYGIATPGAVVDFCLSTPTSNILPFTAPASGIRCPRCESHRTEKLSQFGSTPCKALYRCIACREPFDYFKPY
jgi:ring-1,2-phenylacetyl-CoA epoxidase subunit PaaD